MRHFESAYSTARNLEESTRMKTKRQRMEAWIETRITQLMSTGISVSTDQIVRETCNFFSICLSPLQKTRLGLQIRKIRERVKKRLQRHKRLLPKLAKEWMVDPRLIERWVSAGWISLQYPQKLKILTAMFLEKDYVKIVGPEDIPLDKEIKLWD
jgi:hypothetical protein